MNFRVLEKINLTTDLESPENLFLRKGTNPVPECGRMKSAAQKSLNFYPFARSKHLFLQHINVAE